MSEAISLILKNALSITFFVLIMMLIIEYVNVRTAGAFTKHIKKTGFRQILVSAALGAIPGCLGAYTVVTLYTHKMISFGALTAAFIATMGDEAFLLFSTVPKQAIIITLILFAVALLSGVIIDAVRNKDSSKTDEKPLHFAIHEQEHVNISEPKKTILYNIKHASPHRALLLFGALGIMIYALIGDMGHSHDFLTTADVHVHTESCDGHDHHHFEWLTLTFVVISLISLFIFSIVPEHFLEEHLWNHIVKKHFLKVLLWTTIVITGVYFLNQYMHVQDLVSGYLFHILIVAVLIGFIPESGPHVVFLSLYLSGAIPLSILMANSIVQDGHGALPLIAEDKSAFFKVKFINMAIGLAVGGVGLLAGI